MAAGAGVVSDWALPYPVPTVGDPLPAPGMIFKFEQGFDWDSARWGHVPVPGSAGDVGLGSAVGNETALRLAEGTLLCGAMGGKGDDGVVQDVQDVEGLVFAQRCSSAAGNGTGSVIQLAARPRSVAGTDVDVT